MCDERRSAVAGILDTAVASDVLVARGLYEECWPFLKRTKAKEGPGPGLEPTIDNNLQFESQALTTTLRAPWEQKAQVFRYSFRMALRANRRPFLACLTAAVREILLS